MVTGRALPQERCQTVPRPHPGQLAAPAVDVRRLVGPLAKPVLGSDLVGFVPNELSLWCPFLGLA